MTVQQKHRINTVLKKDVKKICHSAGTMVFFYTLKPERCTYDRSSSVPWLAVWLTCKEMQQCPTFPARKTNKTGL